MADAFKVLADVTLPKAISQVGDDINGDPVYEKHGILYDEGSYVLASDISPDVLKRAEDGEMDHLLEAVSLKEAEESLNLQGDVPRGTFVPEHEVEAEALRNAGHKLVDSEGEPIPDPASDEDTPRRTPRRAPKPKPDGSKDDE